MPFQMYCHAQEKAKSGAAEVIVGLEKIIIDCIQTFISKTGHKPRKILYFRDGVGDGQFGEVSFFVKVDKKLKLLLLRLIFHLSLQTGLE